MHMNSMVGVIENCIGQVVSHFGMYILPHSNPRWSEKFVQTKKKKKVCCIFLHIEGPFKGKYKVSYSENFS